MDCPQGVSRHFSSAVARPSRAIDQRPDTHKGQDISLKGKSLGYGRATTRGKTSHLRGRVWGTDGRPQGSQPRIPTTPAPTLHETALRTTDHKGPSPTSQPLPLLLYTRLC